jgi:hypothetical protein
MAIGVLVGYDDQGRPRVVMDVLLFDHMTAERSIAHTQKTYERMRANRGTRKAWESRDSQGLGMDLSVLHRPGGVATEGTRPRVA